MIELRKDGGLWTVTLNRPDKANSLTAGMLEELADVAEAGAQDDDLRAFILTGAGDRVFSAGADLEAAKAGLAVSPLWERVSGAIAALPCLSVAALNGTLAGGAFGMALACDLRLAVPGAKFFYPVARLGYLPQPSDPGRLAALIGLARAKMILLASQKIGVEEALAWGLVDRVAEPEDLMQAAQDLCRPSLEGNPGVLRAIKGMCA
ncbi:enoyl-CoA hydratase/isomerase family protein [Nioella sp.]|uniref:enoyl-CoA hydratase/isomerase family protein n=1 Tax=Nioella sp. TaxID=1912091 RepID=UPI00351632F6